MSVKTPFYFLRRLTYEECDSYTAVERLHMRNVIRMEDYMCDRDDPNRETRLYNYYLLDTFQKNGRHRFLPVANRPWEVEAYAEEGATPVCMHTRSLDVYVDLPTGETLVNGVPQRRDESDQIKE